MIYIQEKMRCENTSPHGLLIYIYIYFHVGINIDQLHRSRKKPYAIGEVFSPLSWERDGQTQVSDTVNITCYYG